MHPAQTVTFLGLLTLAATQNVSKTAATPPIVTQFLGDTSVDATFTITLPGPPPGGVVYECTVEAEGGPDEFSYEYECESISDIVFSTTAVERRRIAPLVDPAGVLEARIGRKFGVEARQTAPVLADVLPATVTVTSTAVVTSIHSECFYPSNAKPFPHVFGKPTNVPILASQMPVPPVQTTALSALASMLSMDIAAATQPKSTPNIIPAIVSALTANVTTMVTPTPMTAASNTTVASATLTSAATNANPSPIPGQPVSEGINNEVGKLAILIAAAGVAYLLA